jgi:hypothetical protein
LRLKDELDFIECSGFCSGPEEKLVFVLHNPIEATPTQVNAAANTGK